MVEEVQPRGSGPGGSSRRGGLTRLQKLMVETGVKKTPLQVMMENMAFHDETAQSLTRQLEKRTMGRLRRSLQLGEQDPKPSPEEVTEDERLFSEIKRARSLAQSCAVELAPFCHSKMLPAPEREPEESRQAYTVYNSPSARAEAEERAAREAEEESEDVERNEDGSVTIEGEATETEGGNDGDGDGAPQ